MPNFYLTTPLHSVKVRGEVSRRDGQVVNFSPEYEDCRRLAQEKAVPLKMVLQEATCAFWKEFGSGS